MEKFITSNIDTLHPSNFKKYTYQKEFRKILNNSLRLAPTV